MFKAIVSFGVMILVSSSVAWAQSSANEGVNEILEKIQKSKDVNAVLLEIVPLGKMSEKLRLQMDLDEDEQAKFLRFAKAYKMGELPKIGVLLQSKRSPDDQQQILKVCRKMMEFQRGVMERHLTLRKALEAKVRELGISDQEWVESNRNEIKAFTNLIKQMAAEIVKLPS